MAPAGQIVAFHGPGGNVVRAIRKPKTQEKTTGQTPATPAKDAGPAQERGQTES
jgi:hypothetical protein